RDVRKQWKRNRTAFKMKDEDVPVYPTIASQFNDPGITWMFVNLNRLLREKLGLGTEGAAPTDQAPSHVGAAHGRDAKASPSVIPSAARDLASASEQRDPSASPRDDKSGGRITNPRVDWQPHLDTSLKEPRATVLIPGNRGRYLAEIAEQRRSINKAAETQAEIASRAQSYYQVLSELDDPKLPPPLALYADADTSPALVGAASAAMEKPSHAEAPAQSSRGRGSIGGTARAPGESPAHDTETVHGRD